MPGRKIVIGALAAGLCALPATAEAKLMLQLKVLTPTHVTARAPITVSGVVNGEVGAEFVAVFFSKGRCVPKYESEYRLSEDVTRTGVGYLNDQDEQGPFSMTVELGKSGTHAHWLCVYAYHSGKVVGTTVTDRLATKKL